MDLELIMRSLWRRRVQLLVWVLSFAVAVPLLASVFLTRKYSSSTDIAVFPAPDIDPSAALTYQTEPDRYVATQVAIMSARQNVANAAATLHISADALGSMLNISQVGKSDVVRVQATSTSPTMAERASSAVSNAYLDALNSSLNDQYKSAIKSTDDQLRAVNGQVLAISSQLAGLGANQTAQGALQGEVGNLLGQSASLNSKRQQLVVDQQTVNGNTRIVSNASGNSLPIGLTTSRLVLYGAAFGFGIGVLVISLNTAPGRTLDDLEAEEEIEGVAIFGVYESSGGRVSALLHDYVHRRARDVRNIRTSQRIRSIVKAKGPVLLAWTGRDRMLRRALPELIDFTTHGIGMPLSNETETDEVDPISSESLKLVSRRLEVVPETRLIVLAVDTNSVSRSELIDAIGLLRSFDVDLVGIVGIR
jgi:capsular polysaccharide biosynthesis protein